MPLPTLPNELIADIFGKVVETEKLDERDERIMADLCLVSKSFLPLARQQLYRVASLKLVPVDLTPALSESDEDVDDHEGPAEPTLNSLLLVATLATSPHLARFVNVLCLNLGGRAGDEGAEMVREVFKTCSGINEMEIREYWDVGTGSGAFGDVLHNGGSRIRILRLHGGILREDGPLSLALLQLQLEELHLVNHFASLQGEFVYPSPSSQLRSFSYVFVHHLNFNSVLASSHDSLRSLQLMSRGQPFDLSAFAHLETVHYECHHNSGATVDDITTTLASLPSSLKSLRLSSICWEPAQSKQHFYGQLGERRVLHSLPPSLVYLDLQEIFLTPEYILDFVNSPSASPNLRSLGVPPSLFHRRIMDDLRDNEHPSQDYRDLLRRKRTVEEDKRLDQYSAEQEAFAVAVTEAAEGRGIAIVAELHYM
ncbi:hypothetical protein BCR35DRAFT_302859 [Leucosporidium creatinivorum]|uniref:F-box domain-containing protein n=1 Tax=Leucosporidium creatinivorum TaxID=106004 RepID=A0A1Y2FN01_9BASI|nr:hypothetical protein BCR35DRAFT_302859 [Leucosporidium creatinivorum]